MSDDAIAVLGVSIILVGLVGAGIGIWDFFGPWGLLIYISIVLFYAGLAIMDSL